MTQITIQIDDIESEPGDDTEALIEQLVAAALAEHSIDYEGFVAAHKRTVPVREQPLEKFLGLFDGVANTIYRNGYGKQVRQLDSLRQELQPEKGRNKREAPRPQPDHEGFSDLLETVDETVRVIQESRPDDPETVSYALNDLRRQVKELKRATDNEA